jgi:hypothetical protein
MLRALVPRSVAARLGLAVAAAIALAGGVLALVAWTGAEGWAAREFLR